MSHNRYLRHGLLTSSTTIRIGGFFIFAMERASARGRCRLCPAWINCSPGSTPIVLRVLAQRRGYFRDVRRKRDSRRAKCNGDSNFGGHVPDFARYSPSILSEQVSLRPCTNVAVTYYSYRGRLGTAICGRRSVTSIRIP